MNWPHQQGEKRAMWNNGNPRRFRNSCDISFNGKYYFDVLHHAGLDPATARNLDAYCSVAYNTQNNYERGNKLYRPVGGNVVSYSAAECKVRNGRISTELKKHRTRLPFVVYKSIDDDRLSLMRSNWGRRPSPRKTGREIIGETLTEPGFCSTSLLKRRLLGLEQYMFNSVLLQIIIPPNTCGAAVWFFSGDADETEFILDKENGFLVTNSREQPHSFPSQIIDCEWVHSSRNSCQGQAMGL
jgi:hypothetical protein